MNLLREEEIGEDYSVKLCNKYEALRDLLEQENNIDKQWQHIKDTITIYIRISTCQEVVGYKKYQQKEWISAETLQKVKVRKEKKIAVTNCHTRTSNAKAQKENSNAHRIVKKSIKFDKLNYIKNIAEMAEDTAKNGSMKQLYDTTRKLSGKYTKPGSPVKDKRTTPSRQRRANSIDGQNTLKSC